MLKLILLSILLLLKGPTLRVRAREVPRPRQLFGLLRKKLWKGAAIMAFLRSPSEARDQGEFDLPHPHQPILDKNQNTRRNIDIGLGTEEDREVGAMRKHTC